MRAKSKNLNERPAVLALIGISILFFVIITYGWQGLFSGLGTGLAVTIGAVVALIALALAYAIGHERATSGGWTGVALAYFFVLFNVSALGTVNALFLAFQSHNVLRDAFNDGARAIASLDAAIKAEKEVDPYQEYARFRALADSKFEALEQQINNPLSCGQGPVALKRIAELQEILPDFRLLQGSTSNCDQRRIQSLVTAYGKTYQKLVDADPRTQAAQYVENSQRSYDELMAGYKTAKQKSENAQNLAGKKREYFSFAAQHENLRATMESSFVTLRGSSLPALDTTSVAALGDIGQVIPFVLHRLTDVSTYVYLLVAILMDLVVVTAFSRVVSIGGGEGRPSRKGTSRLGAI
jgi:hypothetical protein